LGSERFIERLAFIASFFALGVIALGAFTRLMDAGLGCPDWPFCYGRMILPLTDAAHLHMMHEVNHWVAYKAWVEMIHRYFVGGLSLLIVAMVTIIFSQKILRVRSNIMLSFFLIALLICQIILGQLTVTLKLIPTIVTQHLLGGFLIVSALWLIYLNNNQKKIIIFSEKKSIQKTIPLAFVALFLMLIQIFLGAWTSTHYASLSCPDFPFCNNYQNMTLHIKEAFAFFTPLGLNYEGGLLPDAIRQTIHMAHRLGALVVTLYLFLLIIMALPRLKQDNIFVYPLYALLGFLCIQLCLGISNVIFKLPLVTAISHTVVAALLLLSLITFLFQLIRSNRRVSS